MPLIPAKCTQCGAEIEVDSTQEAAVCRYCQTAFIVEKAIHNYHTHNQYNIENAQVQIVDETTSESKLKSAEVYLTQLKDYKKARKTFLEVTEIAPGDWRGWWGVVKADTHEFTFFECGPTVFEKVAQHRKNAVLMAPEAAKKEIESIWKAYTQEMDAYLEPFRKQYIELCKKESACRVRRDALKAESNAQHQKAEKTRRQANGRNLVAACIGCPIGIGFTGLWAKAFFSALLEDGVQSMFRQLLSEIREDPFVIVGYLLSFGFALVPAFLFVSLIYIIVTTFTAKANLKNVEGLETSSYRFWQASEVDLQKASEEANQIREFLENDRVLSEESDGK